MTEEQRSFLYQLLSTPSPVGSEVQGQEVWAGHMSQYADEVSNDAYGNTWATIRGSSGADGLKVMIEAHADEIGFMVNYIADNGFLSVIPVGGSDVAITRGKRVVFAGAKGNVNGVIGNTAIHLRKDGRAEHAPKWHEVFIDIGASSKQAVLDRGIRVGVVGVYDEPPLELNENRLVSRAIDNRISGYIIARIFEELRSQQVIPAATVYGVNAVQEEVGGNGASMIAERLFPDVAIVFDVTHATDSPGIDKSKCGNITLGGGPALTHGTANHPLVVQRLIEVGDANDVPYQHEAISRTTGTDTDKIFIAKTGIPSALVSIPLRYMHSPVETVDLIDVENTVKLTVEFLKSLKSSDSFGRKINGSTQVQ